MKKRITIRFYTQKHVEYGGYMKICGSVPGLGDWNLENAIEMQWSSSDWWCGEFQFEAISTMPKNNFKLETPSYHLYKPDIVNPFYQESQNYKTRLSVHHPLSGGQIFDDFQSFQLNAEKILSESLDKESEIEYFQRVVEADEEDSSNSNTADDEYSSSVGASSSVCATPNSMDMSSLMDPLSSSIESTTTTTAATTTATTPRYTLNNNQSLSPVLKGISPQLIDFEYKYVIFQSYEATWETCKNHKVSLMLWSQANSVNSSEEEIFIEIRDEWNGGYGIFPSLDFQSKTNAYKSKESEPHEEEPYSFLQPLDPHSIPVYPSQICTFIVMDEGNSETHSVNLVSNFFGSESQKSIRMNPITQAGSSHTLWIGQVYAPQPMKFEYRYVVVSNNNSSIYWEKEIRTFSPSDTSHTLIINHDGPLRISDASMSWIKTGLVGLQELNNNCPILCVVQLLFHIPALKAAVIQLRGKIGFPITQCLGTIFTSMEMGFQTTGIEPLMFQIGSQDAAEVYNIIVTSLLNEINTISQNTGDPALVINHLFEGELSQTAISYHISPESEGSSPDKSIEFHNEKFINLILPVKGFDSLEKSLAYYQNNSVEYQFNRFESQIKFQSLPSTLVIQLDRTDYEFKKTIRVSNHFTFPKRLTINQFKFKLTGILTHYGSNFYEQGHFSYFVKKSKKWFKCDGSNITISNQDEAIFSNFSNSSAYMLVYKKINSNLDK